VYGRQVTIAPNITSQKDREEEDRKVMGTDFYMNGSVRSDDTMWRKVAAGRLESIEAISSPLSFLNKSRYIAYCYDMLLIGFLYLGYFVIACH
jgi:hypothetical protein